MLRCVGFFLFTQECCAERMFSKFRWSRCAPFFFPPVIYRQLRGVPFIFRRPGPACRRQASVHPENRRAPAQCPQTKLLPNLFPTKPNTSCSRVPKCAGRTSFVGCPE